MGGLTGMALSVIAVRVFGTLNLAYQFHQYLGYYIVLCAFFIWLWMLFVACKPHGESISSFFKNESIPIGLIAAGCVFIQLHEPHVLRVLHDESTHAAGALTMHLYKAAFLPAKAHYVGDAYILTDHYASFRQYLFQVLVSLIHDFTGYRVSNVYWLNAVLGLWFLLSAYLAGYKIGGRWSGLTAVGLLATLPLLAQNITSGGYDVLNIALIASLICVAIFYVQAEDAEDRLRLMNLGTATALLLALSRYESVAYLIPWAGVVALRWRELKKLELTRFSVVAPVFLLPNLISHLILFQSRIVTSGPNLQAGHKYFELGYLRQHVEEAIYYFFQFDRQSTNSLLLSLGGVVGLLFLTIVVTRNLKDSAPASRILLIFALWTGALYLLILSQYWSSPTDNLASRFTLPLHLVAALGAGWFVQQLGDWRWKKTAIIISVAVWAIVLTAPASSRAFATKTMANSLGEKWLLEQAKNYDRTSTLFVATSNVHLIAHRYAAISSTNLSEEPWRSVRALKAGIYKEILIYQTFEPDLKTGGWKPRADQSLGAAALEEVASKNVAPTYKVVLSKLIGYRAENGTLITPKDEAPAIQLKTNFPSADAIEAYRFALYP